MWKVIKKQFIIQSRDWAELALVIPGGALFGMLLHYFIKRTDSGAEHYFALGTVMACLFAALLGAIMIFGQFSLYFHTEVSMGCPRKEFLVSFYTVSFVFLLGYLALIVVLNFMEDALCKRLYPELTCEVDFLPYLLKWGIPVIAALCILGIFCSILIMHFGKKAFWVLWVIWMFACVGLPQISEAAEEAPNSLLGRIGIGAAKLFMGIPVQVLIGTLTGICVLCLILSWIYIRKQEVRS